MKENCKKQQKNKQTNKDRKEQGNRSYSERVKS